MHSHVSIGVITWSQAVRGEASVEVRAALPILDSSLGLGIPADIVRIHSGVHTSRIWVRHSNVLGILWIREALVI